MLNIEQLREMDSCGSFWPGASLPSAWQYNAHLKGIARFPDFFCIGAQKAGTTWLFDRLSRNPLTWIPAIKEVDHFSEMYVADTKVWARAQREKKLVDCNTPPEMEAVMGGLGKDDTAYGRLYAAAPPACRTGDFSPEYMLLPAAAIAHIRRLSPHAKIILLVRDHVERFWSHVKHVAAVPENVNQGLVERMLASPYILARADYAGVVSRWSYYFDRRRILIGSFDCLRDDPERLLHEVHDFLEIDGVKGCIEGADRPVYKTFSMKIPEDMYPKILQGMSPYLYSFARFMPEIGEAWLARHKL